MTEEPVSTASCQLGIAGLGVALACNDSTLLEVLRRSYAGFLDPPAIQLVASVDHRRGTGRLVRPAIAPAFTPGRVSFDTPGFEGEIDLQSGRAFLSLASSDPFADLDYFLRVVYALLLFRAGGLLFHAAGILRRGAVYLFFGHSGSGKSTIARLSLQDVVLNDDLVGVLPGSAGWVVHATPFGDPALRTALRSATGPRQGKLAALLRLVQGRDVRLEELRPGHALAEVVSNMPVIPADPRMGAAALARGQDLLAAVPAYRLHFQPAPTFWEVIDALAL